jgi:hypothetical protein
MIHIENKLYAENEREIINQLFIKGGTCSGYAKKLKTITHIYNLQHKLIKTIKN